MYFLWLFISKPGLIQAELESLERVGEPRFRMVKNRRFSIGWVWTWDLGEFTDVKDGFAVVMNMYQTCFFIYSLLKNDHNNHFLIFFVESILIYVTKKKQENKKRSDSIWPMSSDHVHSIHHGSIHKKGSTADFKGWKGFATFAECCSCEKCSKTCFWHDSFLVCMVVCFFSATLWVCFCWRKKLPSAQESFHWTLPDLMISLYPWFFLPEMWQKSSQLVLFLSFLHV